MKKFLVSLCFILYASLAFADSFMPQNDLWKYDCIDCLHTNSMTQELFNKITQAGREIYAENAKKNNEELVINPLWTNPTVNADCCRGCESGKVIVNMYGGLARRDEVTPEGFALVLGHELSHAYAGIPYIDIANRMSAEGQADYGATKEAYRKIAALVPELKKEISFEPYVGQLCAAKIGEELRDCYHALEGGKSLGKLLAVLQGEKIPTYQTPDKTKVRRTNTSYPKTVQCRLDTYLAGFLDKSRPACWYKEPAVDDDMEDPWDWPWGWPWLF